MRTREGRGGDEDNTGGAVQNKTLVNNTLESSTLLTYNILASTPLYFITNTNTENWQIMSKIVAQ